MAIAFEWEPTVLSNTGCQLRFFPLYALGLGAAEAPDLLKAEVLWDDVPGFTKRHARLAADEGFCAFIAQAQATGLKIQGWQRWEGCAFVQMRPAVKHFREPGVRLGRHYEVLGVELAIETLAPGERASACGLRYEEVPVGPGQEQAAQFPLVYQSVSDGTYFPPKGEAARLFTLEQLLTVAIRIGFQQQTVARGPLGAHLAIDIGNTRTCALLLKDDPIGTLNTVDAIRSCCVPVLLDLPMREEAVTRAALTDVDSGIVSSWIVLHQTLFDEPEPTCFQCRYVSGEVPTDSPRRWPWSRAQVERRNLRIEKRIPAMFVRNSPVLLGQEATRLLSLAQVTEMIRQGLQIQQSSPKRYFAEQRPTQLDWSMIPNAWTDRTSVSASKLQTDLLYWMTEQGEVVDPDEGESLHRPMKAPTNPNYPRSASFVWLLVGILERAWDQCNRLKDPAGTFVPYALRDVVITYPSGWTRGEIARYRKCCEDAVKLFTRSNFPRGTEIRLEMTVDEAMASQLPFVFFEIHKFGDNAAAWLRLAGKCRGEGPPSCRVLALDIGGGTSDISVVAYTCREDDDGFGEVALQPTLLLRDGFPDAGDDLARDLLREILFPAIGRIDPDWGKLVCRFFTGEPTSTAMCMRRAKVLRLCLLPMVFRLLGDLASGEADGAMTLERAGVGRGDWDEFYGYLFAAGQPVSPRWYQAFNLNGGLRYDPAQVATLIRARFRRTFELVAAIAAQQDVDLFLMSGKTSEQPELYALAQALLPLTRERIVSAKRYCAGDWYPFVKTDASGMIIDNTIQDAKSVTAVGAALHFLLAHGMVRGWRIEPTRVAPGVACEWGFFDAFKRADGKPFPFNAAGEATIRLDTRKLIARRLSPESCPSAVYRLQPRDATTPPSANARFRATLQRGRDAQTQTEYLALKALTLQTPEGERDCLNAYELAICQQEEALFWQDSGHLL